MLQRVSKNSLDALHKGGGIYSPSSFTLGTNESPIEAKVGRSCGTDLINDEKERCRSELLSCGEAGPGEVPFKGLTATRSAEAMAPILRLPTGAAPVEVGLRSPLAGVKEVKSTCNIWWQRET